MEPKDGTALIITLIMIAFITIISAVTIKSSVFFHTLSLERSAHISKTSALESLLFYGISIAKDRDIYVKNMAKHSVTISPWPPEKGIYTGSLAINPLQNGYYVGAQLEQEANGRAKLSCVIERINNGWRIVPESIKSEFE